MAQGKGTFSVRCATSLDDLKWVFKCATEEGWGMRAMDANNFFTAGVTQDFFIGELDGERISCVLMIRHGEANAFIGYFITLPLYRGKGYGSKTWKAALEGFGTDVEFRLYSVVNMQHVYAKLGFQSGWIGRRYAVTCGRAAEGLSDCKLPSSVADIIPGCKANFENLVAYGKDMVVPSQAYKLVLAAWLSSARDGSWVAIGNEGEVLGYLIMSETSRFPQEGYRIGPFFADSAPIARSLLKMAVEYASPNNFFLDVPKDANIEGNKIVEEELGGQQSFDCIFMGTKGIPNLPLEKVFGLASVEVM